MKDTDKSKAMLIEELEQMRLALGATGRSASMESPSPDRRLLGTLVDLMLEPTVIIDWEGSLLHGNALAADILSVEKSRDLVSMNIADIVHPDSAEEVAADLLRMKESEASFFADYKLQVGGRTLYIESHGTKIDLADGSVNLVSFRDVTKRRRKEENRRKNEAILKNVLDNSSQVIFVKDTVGKYLLVNKRYEDLFGIDNDEIAGKTDYDIFPPSAAEQFQAKDRKALEARGPIEEEEIVPQQGGDHTYLSVKFPLFDKRGKPFATCGIATDITERKQMEEELRAVRALLEQRVHERTTALEESEKVFQALTESTQAMVVIAGIESQNVIYTNPAATKLTGYSFEELTTTPPPILFSERSAREAAQVAEAYFRGEPLPERMEVEIITKQGESRWLESSVALIEIGDAGLHKVVTSFDITIRKRAEQAIKESEQKFRALAESTAAQICILQDDRYLYANQAFLDYFNLDLEELPLVSPNDIIMGAMDPLTIKEALRGWQKMLDRGEELLQFEYKDLAGNWFQGNVTMMHLHGKDAYMSLTFDITELKRVQEELKESEDRYRTIFDTAGTGMISFGQDSVITIANEEWAKLSGYSVSETVGKMTWAQFFTAESLGRMKQYHELRGTDPASVPRAYEARFVDRKGRIYDGIINIQMVPGTQTRVASFQNLTELKRAQREMYRADKMAALGQIIAGVAHEINNPNNFIYFNLPILRKYIEAIRPMLEHHLDDDPNLKILNMPYQEFLDDVFRLLKNMEHGSKRITGIVSELKTYVRSDEEAEMLPRDLMPVIDRVMALVGKQVRKMVGIFEVKLGTDLPKVRINPGKIEQVLINMVINAGQAADKEDSWVKLSATSERQGGVNWVKIVIEDNGAGIPDDIRDQIFEPFFTSKGRETGTGLGLSISHRIIEEHDGRIEVDSETGIGTAFTIFLPICGG